MKNTPSLSSLANQEKSTHLIYISYKSSLSLIHRFFMICILRHGNFHHRVVPLLFRSCRHKEIELKPVSPISRSRRTEVFSGKFWDSTFHQLSGSRKGSKQHWTEFQRLKKPTPLPRFRFVAQKFSRSTNGMTHLVASIPKESPKKLVCKATSPPTRLTRWQNPPQDETHEGRGRGSLNATVPKFSESRFALTLKSNFAHERMSY